MATNDLLIIRRERVEQHERDPGGPRGGPRPPMPPQIPDGPPPPFENEFDDRKRRDFSKKQREKKEREETEEEYVSRRCEEYMHKSLSARCAARHMRPPRISVLLLFVAILALAFHYRGSLRSPIRAAQAAPLESGGRCPSTSLLGALSVAPPPASAHLAGSKHVLGTM